MAGSMRIRATFGGCVLLAGLFAMVGGCETTEGGEWLRWGGSGQDFIADSVGLASQWPEKGPRRLWTRELGDGYSSILVDRGRLYTMYRTDGQEAVICVDARNGKTIWEHRYAESPREGHVSQFGDGPRATPLICGSRVYTIGVAGLMHCLDKRTGRVLWSHDLWTEFDGNVRQHGYASSPVEYKDTVIALVGGAGQSIIAFDQKDGSVRWKNLSFKNSYSSPKIYHVGGRDELITFMEEEVIGVDPDNGELLWRYPHKNAFGQNISMPILDGDMLMVSSPQAGAKGLRLTLHGDKTDVEEVWSTRKIQFYHVSAVRVGDLVYGSTGARSPTFIAAVNIKTGKIAWRKRGFAKANCVYADGKLIILDEDGELGLTTATPEDLIVHSKVKLLDHVAWTVPTIVGKTMYVRDKKHLMALDLG